MRASAARFGSELRDDRGAVAVWFAIVAVPLTIISLGLVDLNRATTAKGNLQDALDSAALYAARSNATTPEAIQAEGAKALAANLRAFEGVTLKNSSFTLNGSTVVASATAGVDPIIAHLWQNTDIPVTARAEVVRNSRNIEVALVLDITYSMLDEMEDLKTAAKDLVELVVKPPAQQTPYYSKAALVPYSIAVNAGTYADAARGAIQAAKSVTNVAWFKSAAVNISGATRANPVVITTSSNHGYSTGDIVRITGVSGMTQLNNKIYTITRISNTTFSLNSVNGTNYNSYSSSSGDQVRACHVANCYPVITAANHGFATDDWVRLDNIGGTTQLNGNTYEITRVTADTFSVPVNPFGNPTLSAFTTSTGNAWCTTAGCEYYRYTTAAGGTRVNQVATCVTERTGNDKYTDTKTSGTGGVPVGLNYPVNSGFLNTCPTVTIEPLTSTKQTLIDKIDSFTAQGVTAGQIGTAWGWYMLSPNFNNMWPAGSQPGPYGDPEYLKVMVLMTDGEFNTMHCNGVISSDSSAFTSNNEKINCASTNGDPFVQAKALCTAMKAADKGIIIYTVGFALTNAGAIDVMNQCATSNKHVYLPNSGTDLKTAFKAIGEDISSLRISR